MSTPWLGCKKWVFRKVFDKAHSPSFHRTFGDLQRGYDSLKEIPAFHSFDCSLFFLGAKGFVHGWALCNTHGGEGGEYTGTIK